MQTEWVQILQGKIDWSIISNPTVVARPANFGAREATKPSNGFPGRTKPNQSTDTGHRCPSTLGSQMVQFLVPLSTLSSANRDPSLDPPRLSGDTGPFLVGSMVKDEVPPGQAGGLWGQKGPGESVPLGARRVQPAGHERLQAGPSLGDEGQVRRTLGLRVFVYVDDSRATGHSRWISWRAFRHFASVCTRHGIQIVERKSNFPSQVPQSWAGTGTNTDTSGGQVSATVLEKKWQKTKDCVHQLAELVRAADAAAPLGSSEAVRILLKPLLSIMGFLVYVVRTYDWMTPYLKGLNNVINWWRPGYKDGWELTERAAREHERAQEEAERDLTSESHTMMFRRAHEEDLDEVVPVAVEPEAPSTVEVFDRLRRDVKALLELTSSEDPPRRRIRSKEVLVALYLPGDASGKGFGSALIWREGVEYEAGVWRCEWHERSSNFREADNLVRRIEVLVRGGLRGAEIFHLHRQLRLRVLLLQGLFEDLAQALRRHTEAVQGRPGGGSHDPRRLDRGHAHEGDRRGQALPRRHARRHHGRHGSAEPGPRRPGSRPEVLRGGDQVDPQLVEARPGCSHPWGKPPLVEVTKDNMFELKDVVGSRLWALPPDAMKTALEMFAEDR
ncbi:hypothetical protein THAOC_29653, partial [Thalassiosira oceanica]